MQIILYDSPDLEVTEQEETGDIWITRRDGKEETNINVNELDREYAKLYPKARAYDNLLAALAEFIRINDDKNLQSFLDGYLRE